MQLSELKQNSRAVEEGAWIDDIPGCGDLRVKTRGLNNADYRAAMERKLKAVPRKERRAGLGPQTERRLQVECLVETCLQEWQNLQGANGPIPIAEAKALLLDPDYEPLFQGCVYAAAVVGDEAAADQEIQRGNS